MLYNDPKIIFVHAPKTGGSSIGTLLKNYEASGELKERDKRFDNHVSLQYIYDHGISLEEYTIFIVKRNPWERILSFYLMYEQHTIFSKFYNLVTPKHAFNEDYFHYLEVNGKIPDHIKMLDFNNLVEDTMQLCKSLGLSDLDEKFPHRKENKDVKKLYGYLLYDEKFIEIIAKKYKREIEYFDFKPPI